MLLRLLMGIPDDLGWRVEQTAVENTRAHGTISLSASGLGALVFVCAVWTINADASRTLTGSAFHAPTVGLHQDNLTPLAAGIVATVGPSTMPGLLAQSATPGAGDPVLPPLVCAPATLRAPRREPRVLPR